MLLGFPNRGWLGKAGRRLALQMTSLGNVNNDGLSGCLNQTVERNDTFGKDYRKPSFFKPNIRVSCNSPFNQVYATLLLDYGYG